MLLILLYSHRVRSLCGLSMCYCDCDVDHFIDLIAQDEAIAVSCWDFSPPHQDAAGGGGKGWHIGGTAGGHWSKEVKVKV